MIDAHYVPLGTVPIGATSIRKGESIMSKTRIAAVDAGNDAIKAVCGAVTNRIWIPNVIAPEAEHRQLVQLEASLFDGLHVQIQSPALRCGGGTFAMGTLAMTHRHAMEVPADQIKAESDQNLIVALVALAIDALECGEFQIKKGVTQASYNLACGLPLMEVKVGRKQGFAQRLKSGVHQVRFLDTPKYGGHVVDIRFEDVRVFAEGHAAIADLTIGDYGRPRRDGLADLTILLADVGSVTSDFCVIGARGKLDNLNSMGLQEGVSPYLDVIIARVQQETGHRFKNRQELVMCLTDPRPERRNRVSYKRIPIGRIVDEELAKLARVEYQTVRILFNAVGNIDVAFLIGGGGLLLQPYLEAINVDKLPLRFLEGQEEAVWTNALGYFKLLQMAVRGGVAK